MKRPLPAAAIRPPWASALRALLRARWKAHRQEWKACRRKFSPESVHETRVAARRLRAALELLAAAVGMDDLGRARRALKQHLNLFATLRDAQAQQSLLPALRLPRAVEREYAEFLRRRGLKAMRRAKRGLAGINTHGIAKAVRGLDHALQQRMDAVGEAEMRAVVAERFRHVCERSDELEAQRPETIHATRVAFKRFRYSVEMLAPLLSGRHRVQVPAMRRYQALMGAVQDACVSLEWFGEFAAHARLDAATLERVQSRLVARRAQAIARYLRQAGTLRDFWPI